MLAFVHIPKTAGTAARQLLEQRFPSPRLGFIYDRSPGRPLSEFVAMTAEQWQQYDAVVGHFAFGIHHFIPTRTRYLTFLRNPVERVISLYFHNVHRPSRYHDRIHAEGIGLAEFVRSRVSCQVENSMTQFIAGIEHVAERDRAVFRHGCPERLLDVAKQNLVEWFDVIGFTERPDESFQLLAGYFGLPPAPVARVNANPDRPPSAQIDPETIELISTANRLDMELYEFAHQRFEKQLRALGPRAPA